MKSFNEWMNEIDNIIGNICGMSYLDLPDYAYQDAFDDECSPYEVAMAALDNAGFPLN
jgi:hypothetical protein